MNKTILITGSTDGIGKLAAIKLAKEGHEIYLHGRSPEKLATVISEIKALTANDKIKGFVADFSDLAAVKEMAAQVNKEISQIDVLINNAGVYKSPIQQTEAGFDTRLVVNYFAPYLFTKEVLHLLRNSTAPRMLNISSAGQATINYDLLFGRQQQNDTQQSYAQSKLALIMWSFNLAKAEPSIAVIAVNPGSLLNTNMAREAFGRFWSSADKGGNLLYDLAVSEEYEGVTGKYFDNDKGDKKGSFGDAHKDAYDEEAIRKLIDATEIILNSKYD